MVKKTEDETVVNKNEKGEAKNGTTESGQTDKVENTESIPQNGATEIKTTPAPNDVAKKADADRTEEEVKFADESNPNQKGRFEGAEGEYDQDGNERSGGKSYGVSANHSKKTVEGNEGEKPEESEADYSQRVYSRGGDLTGREDNNSEWGVKDQQKVEEELSDKKHNIVARVIISAGDYLKVKWFRDNKPFAVFKDKKGDKAEAKAEAKKFLSEQTKDL